VPIYEFYCADCHTVFNFLAKRPVIRKRPSCPKCGRPKLDRQISRFAISKGRPEPDQSGPPMPDLDEAQMERAFAEMASDAEGLDEDDPRQMAVVMRKLYERTGLNLGKGMEEAMRRLEAGEDPDKIEEEMGDLLEEEDPLMFESRGSLKRLSDKLRPPNVDETLYEL
jgi:putative FmdB family regulatory protein